MVGSHHRVIMKSSEKRKAEARKSVANDNSISIQAAAVHDEHSETRNLAENMHNYLGSDPSAGIWNGWGLSTPSRYTI